MQERLACLMGKQRIFVPHILEKLFKNSSSLSKSCSDTQPRAVPTVLSAVSVPVCAQRSLAVPPDPWACGTGRFPSSGISGLCCQRCLVPAPFPPAQAFPPTRGGPAVPLSCRPTGGAHGARFPSAETRPSLREPTRHRAPASPRSSFR